ncbi:hypothetical protein [Pedobacter sp. GR22-6]|uniref:hypothetical protein n=1 Tax=Pedobacter sp. GR22-6 TaxID=3127957 RepID=UPI00307E18B1
MRITIEASLQEAKELIDLIGDNNALQQIRQQVISASETGSMDLGSRVPKEGDEPYVDRIE